MSTLVGIVNIALGLIYTCYGIMTIVDLKRGWSTMGMSHFGLAWIAMAFTCGPHHLEHGLHSLAFGQRGGPLDLVMVLVGAPAGVTWFLLRVEALSGRSGDRLIVGTPRWVSALPLLTPAYLLVAFGWGAWLLSHRAQLTPKLTPNILLLGLYMMIGYYLLRTQLANRESLGGWSLSGLALTLVFPTCGIMHAAFAVYASSGRYSVDTTGLLIDWLAVPAAIYFVWVVRALHAGHFTDWNEGATGVLPESAEVVFA